MAEFTIYPAIDLRNGMIVRLQQGDPQRQTIYAQDPSDHIQRWLKAGIHWLHVVNLDGAFSEKDAANCQVLVEIIHLANEYRAQVQFGGGLRSLQEIGRALELGVARTILGTAAVEQPEIVSTAIQQFGTEQIAVGLDARQGFVYTHGWKERTSFLANEFAQRLESAGLRWLIYTDITRDGMSSGLNIPAAIELAQTTRLNLIASGGVEGPEDVLRAREAGLAGVIIGRALYEGKINLDELV